MLHKSVVINDVMHLSFKSVCNKGHKGVICNTTSSSCSSQSTRPIGQLLGKNYLSFLDFTLYVPVKVNKHCLLDTPRAVRVSEKTWQVEKKISVESVQTNFQTKLLHAYVQCVYIVSAEYQIAPSKAVV